MKMIASEHKRGDGKATYDLDRTGRLERRRTAERGQRRSAVLPGTAVLGRPPIAMCIVADGVGGHLGGKVASHWAVETLKRELADLFFPTDPRATLHLTRTEIQLCSTTMQDEQRPSDTALDQPHPQGDRTRQPGRPRIRLAPSRRSDGRRLDGHDGPGQGHARLRGQRGRQPHLSAARQPPDALDARSLARRRTGRRRPDHRQRKRSTTPSPT